MQTITSQNLTVKINPKGAELVSLFNHENQTEYMWSADPNFWGKSSPVLFPIVGSLKNNVYRFEGKEYTLPRHGFARDREFAVEKSSENSVTFLLTHDDNSLKVYPFKFEFRLIYTLINNTLSVTYAVKNIGEGEMFFSVGGHPAFAVPLAENTNYDDYYLKFNKTETFKRWGLTNEGLIETQPFDFLIKTNILPLTKELFYDDAIVFKNLESTSITLKSDNVNQQLQFDFEGFPFLGIWAAKNADFVCIEPWCGIADAANHNQELTEKEGIMCLIANEIFEKTWCVTV
ncbi:aldose 1-epimerase family protein [Arcicella sp. LKC2W]|uniref:aldose 1-epimerase family protein n=1 Tax=Arcicella sp. LKC2W TaxID=2984198 RepID=UPI002B1FB7EE|nr:aldose 1-epimerase family protein [Arcicella sp. LKC2W]MEA5458788.1 aldose 1-epimerase family protein [Arcicella sp. LKC2W]